MAAVLPTALDTDSDGCMHDYVVKGLAAKCAVC